MELVHSRLAGLKSLCAYSRVDLHSRNHRSDPWTAGSRGGDDWASRIWTWTLVVEGGGFTPQELWEGGVTLEELQSAGFTIQQLVETGCDLEQLREVGFTRLWMEAKVTPLSDHGRFFSLSWCFVIGILDWYKTVGLTTWVQIGIIWNHDFWSMLCCIHVQHCATSYQSFCTVVSSWFYHRFIQP